MRKTVKWTLFGFVLLILSTLSLTGCGKTGKAVSTGVSATVNEKIAEKTLSTVLTGLFSGPDQELTRAMRSSATVLGLGISEKPASSKSGEADALIQKKFGAYFTEKELDVFVSQYLSVYQLFAEGNGYRMTVDSIGISKTKDGYGFSAEVQYGDAGINRTATVSGTAQFVESGKIASFRIRSDGHLMADLQKKSK